jgi:hypothetical protein
MDHGYLNNMYTTPQELFAKIIYDFLWRVILLGIVAAGIACVNEVKPSIGEKYPETAWNIKNIFKLLLLFLIVEYSIPFVVGIVFCGNFTSFLSKESVWSSGLAGLIVYSIVLTIICYHVIYKYNKPLTILGFQKNSIKSGLLWGFCVLLFLEIMFIFIKHLKIAYSPKGDVDKDLLWYLMIIIMGPVTEEVFFRGYIYPAFRRKAGIIWAMMFSSACFFIFHRSETLWFNAFVIGIILCFIYEKSGSLIATIMGHIFSNAFICIKKYYYGKLIYTTPWPIIWTVLFITIVTIYIIYRLPPLRSDTRAISDPPPAS